jgi:hypothetical protein
MHLTARSETVRNLSRTLLSLPKSPRRSCLEAVCGQKGAFHGPAKKPSAMHVELTDLPTSDALPTTVDGEDRRAAELRAMTAEQFLQLGTYQVMYIKSDTRDGETLFTLYGANGTPYVTFDAIGVGGELVAKLGLSVVAVH